MNIKTWVAVTLLLLLAWGTRLPSLAHLATQADEGVHVTVAELVAIEDMRIYGDLFENRTPALEWLLAGFFRLVGPHIFSARILTVATTMLTATLLFALGRRIVARFAPPQAAALGLLAPTLFMFDPLSIFWSRFVMLEHFSTAAAVASMFVALIAIQYESRAAWFSAGLLAALAIAFKQSELVLLGVMLIFFAVQFVTSARRANTMRLLASWLAGLALGAALLLGVLALQGTLQPFFQFVSGAGQLAPLANIQPKAAEVANWSLRNPYPWLLLPAMGFALWFRRPALRLILLWFLAEALFLLLPAELDLRPGGFSHYALPMLASASVIATIGARALWQALYARRRLQTVANVAIIIAVLLTAPDWLAATLSTTRSRDYPQATLAQETQIGQAAALVTPADQSIVVLANAVFYHRAQRPPASRYFHWPGYLAQSPLARPAIDGLNSALSDPTVAAAIVSRLHLQERLPQEIQAALWQDWTPAALFPYAYQGDVFLLLPRSSAPATAPTARFGRQIELLALKAQWLDPQNLLVALWWRAEPVPPSDYTVFVHITGADATLLAQDDSVPVAGLRPTSTWQEGEAVLDYHWIHFPEGLSPRDASLSVGLYDPSTGRRLPLDPAAAGADAYSQPLQPAQ